MSFSFARCFLVVLVIGLLLGGCTSSPRFTTLKDAYAGRFLIGTACDPGNYSEAEQANIKANYNIITPENCMKPGNIHPTENTFSWNRPDTLVQWCEDNNIQVWGHNLCWHAQTANWFFQAPSGGEVSRDLLMKRFRSHILTVAGRYKGRIKGWDVVNEAIADGGNASTATTENLRVSNWSRIIGPEFLTMAFKWAHEADPKAELYYNDYNIESGHKHASSMILLKRLIADGAPITGVGIQGHWDSNPNLREIERAIQDYKSLGLKVSITELDVALTGTNSGALPGSGAGQLGATAATQAATNPTSRVTSDSGTQRALQSQANAFARLFELFNKYPGTIERVTVWGISDRRSWRANQRPLLFDAQMQAKPAFEAVLVAATHHGRPSSYASLLDRQEGTGANTIAVAAKLPLRIKAGAVEPFTDSQGVLWAADIGFVGGQTMDRTDSLQITSADRPELFKTERYFSGPNGAYHFKVPNGKCVVRLYFSEDYNGNRSPDARRFTYAVKDGDAAGIVVKEVKDFSPWAAAGGPAKGYIDSIPLTVTSGQITILFTAQVQSPQINAIEIVPL
jgi:endo-1,4-beta-xylanase